MLSYAPDKQSLIKWLELISSTPEKRLAIHHIGEFYLYLTGIKYINTHKECTEAFKRWYDIYQGIKSRDFIPIKSWINEFAKKNDYIVQRDNAAFGFTFTFFTRDEWYVRKG